ncbi:hypothetical protein NDU88_010740 [Pleurodeles waltl]|uniref:Uncharacterized protein n=1 Tax=Pleurodeles waltl TaxID=8319 RepID=A0AAV7PYS4_PLEWA|nr:hypothetical protein NDU88_010740 [Pleurodeles waltl]
MHWPTPTGPERLFSGSETRPAECWGAASPLAGGPPSSKNTAQCLVRRVTSRRELRLLDRRSSPPGSLPRFLDAGLEDPVSPGGPAAARKPLDVLRRWRHVTDLGPGNCSGRPETRGFNRRSSPARNNPHS